MYEEKKAFPIKYAIIGGALLFVIIVIAIIIGNQPDYEQMRKDKISMIEAAALKYGNDHEDQYAVIKGNCLTVEKLIEEGYLESEAKDRNVIFDPTDKTSKTILNDEIEVTYDEDFIAIYMDGKTCEAEIDEDLFKVTTSNKTSNSIILKLEVPPLTMINTIKWSEVDNEEYRDSGVGTSQPYNNIKTGDHVVNIIVVIENNDGSTTDVKVKSSFTIDPIVAPKVRIDEQSSDIVIIEYPKPDTVSDEYQTYDYSYLLNTEDETQAVAATSDVTSYQFAETGYIIAVVTDGDNVVKSERLDVVVIPPCEDTEWSVCAGCETDCGSSCEGTQTSNCGTVRTCPVQGYCQPVVKHNLTINVINGSPEVTEEEIVEGEVFTLENIKANSGYTYKSATCNNSGRISYSSSTRKATIRNITKDTVCNITFAKTTVTTYYTVTFRSSIDNSIIKTTKVLKGNKVSSPTAPSIDGYTFTNWTYNGSKYDFNSSVNSNITIVAQYKNNPTVYKITVTFVTNNGQSNRYAYVLPGGLVAKPSDPIRAGYSFQGWSYEGKEFNFMTPITKPIEIQAVWVSLKTVKVSISCAQTTCQGIATLPNFNKIDSLVPSAGKVSYTMSGNSITIVLTGATSADVLVNYT